MFADDSNVLFWSSFQHPYYPGVDLNNQPSHYHFYPLSANTSGITFQNLVDTKLIPTLIEYKPELILISAGFDAHQADPLAALNFQDKDYYEVTQKIVTIAQQVCKGRVISTLEGGYNLTALANAYIAHVRALR